MKLSYLINRINYKLGQYVFTEMYGQDDIIDEINNALVDLYSYGIFWDFAIDVYNNTTEIPAVVTSNSYTMAFYIRDIVDLTSIENGEKFPCQFNKFGRFSNWNNQSADVREYTFSGNTVTLSNSKDIEMVYMRSPKVYTNSATDLEGEMDVPNDFIGVLKDMVLSNMLPIYMSDGIALADRYFQKAELRLQRLASKYGRKYANKGIAVATPGQGNTVQNRNIAQVSPVGGSFY